MVARVEPRASKKKATVPTPSPPLLAAVRTKTNKFSRDFKNNTAWEKQRLHQQTTPDDLDAVERKDRKGKGLQ